MREIRIPGRRLPAPFSAILELLEVGGFVVYPKEAALHNVQPTSGTCHVFRQFPGFGFLLLSSQFLSCPLAANARRRVAIKETAIWNTDRIGW